MLHTTNFCPALWLVLLLYVFVMWYRVVFVRFSDLFSVLVAFLRVLLLFGLVPHVNRDSDQYAVFNDHECLQPDPNTVCGPWVHRMRLWHSLWSNCGSVGCKSSQLQVIDIEFISNTCLSFLEKLFVVTVFKSSPKPFNFSSYSCLHVLGSFQQFLAFMSPLRVSKRSQAVLVKVLNSMAGCGSLDRTILNGKITVARCV